MNNEDAKKILDLYRSRKNIKSSKRTQDWYKSHKLEKTFILVNDEIRLVCPGMKHDDLTLIPLPPKQKC